MVDLASGTHEISSAASERVLRATRDADDALAVLGVCLEFLSERTDGEARQAVEDAVSAVRMLEVAVSGIRQETMHPESTGEGGLR